MLSGKGLKPGIVWERVKYDLLLIVFAGSSGLSVASLMLNQTAAYKTNPNSKYL